MTINNQFIVLGGGCFWCLDAYFRLIKGIVSVECGYSGGDVVNPTYEQVCTGQTNHAEVVKITYYENLISLDDILIIFWTIHDPTTINQQGADKGSQYRSAVFVNNKGQAIIAQDIKRQMQKYWDKPIVTEINLLDKFYKAESYHQDYFRLNPEASYCQVVINPKIAKIKQIFKDYLKDS
jgi:methionine-S-sulfoxide reductase